MLDDIIVTAVRDVFTVPVARGYTNQMVARPQYGLSLCDGAGKILYHYNGKSYLSDRDHAVLLPMGATYVLDCRESGYFPLINFLGTGTGLDSFYSIPLRQPDGLLRSYESLKTLFLYRHRHARVMSVLYDMLATLATEEGSNGKEQLLAPAMRYLEEHYCDPALQNSALAACAHVSEVYFRRLFKEAYRTTPRQYILDLRLKRAKELLESEAMPVGHVAEACGFSGVYHFCRAFRAATGLSPTDYRRRFGGRHI